MPKRNAFLSAVEKEANRIVAATRHIQTQMCLDAAMIAANEVFNMGPTRCQEFASAFSEALKTIAETTIKDGKDDKELWYTKDSLDKRLVKICGEHFVPWEERYQ